MVTQGSDENSPSPMDMKETLSVLFKAKSEKEKQNAYSLLSSLFASQNDITKIVQHHHQQLYKCISRDVLNTNPGVLGLVLKTIELCVKDGRFIAKGSKEELEMLFCSILKMGKQKQSEEITKHILFVLTQQKFPSAVVLHQVDVVLDTLEYIHSTDKNLFCTGILDTIARLHEILIPNFSSFAPRWCLLVFPYLGHPSLPVRGKCANLLKFYKSSLVGNLDLGKQVLKFIDSDLGKPLLSLVVKSPEYVMDMWSLILDVVGKAIHKGSTINAMLEIIETGFKGSPDSRIFSFRAWRSLVNNFALDTDVISDAKRIRLLMMVLKTNNAKTEAVAMEKLTTWWHVITSIGNKLSSTVEQIIYPLLQFCIGNVNQSSMNAPQSPNLSLKMSGPSGSKLSSIQSRLGTQQLPAFPLLQKLGCEVIGHLLSKVVDGDENLSVKWTLASLPNEAFSSPATFVKHAPFIMMSLDTLLKTLGDEVQDSLVIHIWRSLFNHLRAAMEKGSKVECRDVFSEFLSHFYSLVQVECICTQTLLKLFEIISNFPTKVLSSTLYNTGVGTTVKGCPALLLCEVLFRPAFLKISSQEDHYIQLFTNMVSAGASNQQGALSFVQAVNNLLDSSYEGLTSSDLMCRLWIILAHNLLENITATNEVNQGDSLDYNFGCLYDVLLLPIKHQLASKISQGVSKTMVRTWKDLYHSFARLSALVTTAEANICLEELSSKVVNVWSPEFKDAANLEFLSTVCQKMSDCIEFSALSSNRKQGAFTLSPSKWNKRRQRPMGNLHSFVYLIAKTQAESNSLLDQLGDKAYAQKQGSSTQSMTSFVNTLFDSRGSSFGPLLSFVNAMVDIYTRLFTHIPANMVAHVLDALSSPMARLYNSKAQTGGVKIFVPSVITKLEKLWFEISNCVTGRYNDQYDSAFLATLSPLLEVTFPHFRRAIKTQTLTLWSSTFSKSVGLKYPEDLEKVLRRVKEKTAIVLPGLITVDDNVIAETPFSEASQTQGESQVAAPVLPGLHSPKPQRGSFLNRDISPGKKSPVSVRLSPAKGVSPKEGKSLFSGCRNISTDLNMMSDKDFVVISSPTKKRRPLTEHQKEVLKEKRVLPAMYNNLDASQDVSLMSQLNAESQQESMLCANVITVESSDTQTGPGKPKACDVKEEKSSKELNKEDSSSTGFTVPKQLLPSTRRRSVRIKEMTVEEESSLKEATSTVSKKPALQESEKTSENNKMPAVLSKEEKNSPPQDKQDMVMSSLEISVESSVEPSQTDICSTSKETEPASFGMFRTKNQSAAVVNDPFSTPSKSNSANLVTSEKRPRRVSLRKLQSNEESSLETPAVVKTIDVETKKVKSPRRVPLQRIHDQKSDKTATNNANEVETNKPDALTGVDNVKSKSNDLLSPVNSPHKLKAVKVVVTDVLSPQKKDGTPVRKRKFSDIEDGNNSPLEQSPVVPITLVEDTQQSPPKIGKSSAESASIAETPVKGDDSPSPAIRSIRKLFADDDDVGSINNKPESIDSTPNTHLVKVPSSISSDVDDSQKNSSNESEVKAQDNLDILSQGFEPSQEKSKESVTDSKFQETLPESEILQSSSEQITEEADDMMMMMMPVPTLSSQVPDHGLSGRWDSSSGSKSSSSVESDQMIKTMSGTESEFNPSQPTLRDDCSQTTTITKKKINVPQTLASTRTRRSKVVKKMGSGLISSGDETSNKVKDSEVEPPSNSLALVEVIMETKASIEKVGVKSQADSEEHISKQSSIDDCHDKDKSLKSSESISNIDKESKIKASPEIGEVTPDIKSPADNSSVQRCSTTKKKRMMARKLSAKLGFESNKEAADISDSVAESLNEGDVVKSEKLRRKMAKNSDARLVSSARRRISPALSPPQVRSKHLLRMRSKAARKLSPSPPAKRPRIQKEDVNTEPNNSMDDQPLSLLIASKKAKSKKYCETKIVGDQDNTTKVTVTDNLAHEKDEEDTPLSMLTSKKIINKVEEEKIGIDTQGKDEENKNMKVADDKEDQSEKNLNVREEMSCVEVDSCQDLMDVDSVENDVQEENVKNNVEDSMELDIEPVKTTKEVECTTHVMTFTEEEIPPGQVAPPCVELEGSTGSDEVFHHVKDKAVEDAFGFEDLIDDRKPSVATTVSAVEKPDTTSEDIKTNDGSADSVRIDNEKETGEFQEKEMSETVSEPEKRDKDSIDDDADVKKKENDDEKEITEEYVPSNWSPSKSPSSSILRKSGSTPIGEKSRRKVSFAEPVVSGESPVREKYHAESLPTSPLICHTQSCSLGFTRPSSSGIKGSIRGSGYRRRLEVAMKKVNGSLRQRTMLSPSPSPLSQNSYKGTPESQLDSVNPIFPDLVDCKASLDCILPQLTSSLWYRGLCQLMKGRNLHTIGDLSALTEVQVNQMPIRCPKVDTVRDALTNYQNQHGGATPKSKSIFSNSNVNLEGKDSTAVPEAPGTPKSDGATIGQAVTPSSIADEGIKILPSVENDLSQLSPIKDPALNCDKSTPTEGSVLSQHVVEGATSSSSSSSSVPSTNTQPEQLSTADSQSIVSVLSSLTDKNSLSELKNLKMSELFDVHQNLNVLFGAVVEEMKGRSLQS